MDFDEMREELEEILDQSFELEETTVYLSEGYFEKLTYLAGLSSELKRLNNRYKNLLKEVLSSENYEDISTIKRYIEKEL